MERDSRLLWLQLCIRGPLVSFPLPPSVANHSCCLHSEPCNTVDVSECICRWKCQVSWQLQDVSTVLLPSYSVQDGQRSPYLGGILSGRATTSMLLTSPTWLSLLCCDLVSCIVYVPHIQVCAVPSIICFRVCDMCYTLSVQSPVPPLVVPSLGSGSSQTQPLANSWGLQRG